MAKQTVIGVPVIIIALISFFIIYAIMVPPSERISMFESKDKLGTNTVQIRDKMFIPKTLTIKKGSTVKWVNEDDINNRISGSNFRSGILHPNERYIHSFDETGVYVYASEFYPEFTGKIIVE